MSLYEFIQKTDYYSELKKDLIYGHSTIESLFYFASQFMEIREYSSNEVIYHQGDIAECVYLILFGKIAFKAFGYTSKLYSFEEYCSYLRSITDDDNFLIQSIIHHNEHIYPIRHILDIHIVPFLITKMEIIKYAAVSDVQSISSLYAKKYIEATYMQFNEVLSNELSMDAYYDNIMLSFSEREMYYSKLLSPNRSEVTIISYTPVMSEDKISCFGNFKLGDNEHKLSETVTAASPTILLLINKRLYTNCVLNDQKGLIEKEINHLHQYYFFRGMRRGLFAKFFFFEFNLEDYPLNHILYKENEPMDKLYIIKEGSVELSINHKSLFELKSIIFKLKALDSNRFNREEYDDTVQLINSLPSLMQVLQQKKNFVLFKTSKTVLSEWEYYYNTNAVYTARVASERARIYSIPLSKLDDNKNEDIGALNHYLKEAAFGKLSGILKRIISIKKSQFEKVDIEYANRMREEQEIVNSIGKAPQANKDDEARVDDSSGRTRNNPLKYSYSAMKTLPANQSFSKDRKQLAHRKINSLCNIPDSVRYRNQHTSEEKGKSLFYSKIKSPIASSSNKVPLNLKEGIILIEKKRKEQRKEQNKNTSANIPHTLPNISPVPPRSRNMKRSFPSLASLPRINANNSQGLISLELPIGASHSNKKTLNYLTVKKYRQYSNKVMMDAIKIKYSTKGKNSIIK